MGHVCVHLRLQVCWSLWNKQYVILTMYRLNDNYLDVCTAFRVLMYNRNNYVGIYIFLVFPLLIRLCLFNLWIWTFCWRCWPTLNPSFWSPSSFFCNPAESHFLLSWGCGHLGFGLHVLSILVFVILRTWLYLVCDIGLVFLCLVSFFYSFHVIDLSVLIWTFSTTCFVLIISARIWCMWYGVCKDCSNSLFKKNIFF